MEHTTRDLATTVYQKLIEAKCALQSLSLDDGLTENERTCMIVDVHELEHLVHVYERYKELSHFEF